MYVSFTALVVTVLFSVPMFSQNPISNLFEYQINQSPFEGNCSPACTGSKVCDHQSNRCRYPCDTHNNCSDSTNYVCSPLTNLCEPACSAPSDCLNLPGKGFNFQCQIKDPNSTSETGYCQKACTVSSECGAGFVCARGVCAVGCTEEDQCNPGQSCDLVTGSCGIPCSETYNTCANFAQTTCSPTGMICAPSCATSTSCKNLSAQICFVSDSSKETTGTCEETCLSGAGQSCTLLGSSFEGRCEPLAGKSLSSTGSSSASSTKDLCLLQCGKLANCPQGLSCTSCSGGGSCKAKSCSGANDCNCNKDTCIKGQCQIGCGTGKNCPSGENCINNQCQKPTPCSHDSTCQATLNEDYICDSTTKICVEKSCSSSKLCSVKHANCFEGKCASGTCGDGVLGTDEVCDAGPDTGKNGRCSSDCKFVCAVYVDYAKGASTNDGSTWSRAVGKIGSGGSSPTGAFSKLTAPNPAGTAGSTCKGDVKGTKWISGGSHDTSPACPCGYGIWVSNTKTGEPETNPIILSNPMALYGGFVGTETSIDDRVAKYLGPLPLGPYGPSGTVLSPSSSSGFTVNLTHSTDQVIIDGFQVTNSTGSTGGIYIEKGTATLQNLRLANNHTTESGGGILNTGTMNLKDSMLWMNSAEQNGGGISHGGTGSSTIENVVFYGNAIKSISGNSLHLAPMCTAGGTGREQGCPAGMGCPSMGGLCTGIPTCTNPVTGTTLICPQGWQCPSSEKPPTTATPCTVVPCTVSSDCPGGYICTEPSSSSTSKTCSLSTATVHSGGGLYVGSKAGALTVENSKFNANYAYYAGGGIYADATITLTNNLFANNWASFAGGGVYLDSSSSTLDHLTFIDNKAYVNGGGGLYATNFVDLSDSLFRNNKGLYPVNTTSFKEWSGNSSNSSTTFQNGFAEWGGNRKGERSMASLSQGIQYTSSLSPKRLNPSASMTFSKVDICPMTSYEPRNDVLCDGSQVCGKTNPPGDCTGFGLSCNSGALSNPDVFGKSATNTVANTCDITGDFGNCSAPLYLNCTNAGGFTGFSSSSSKSRIAFVTNFSYVPGPQTIKKIPGGVFHTASGADEICQWESTANRAQLKGTFRAIIASQNHSAKDRLAIAAGDPTPIAMPDGTIISPQGIEGFFSGGNMIHIVPNGGSVGDESVITGATDPVTGTTQLESSCQHWTSSDDTSKYYYGSTMNRENWFNNSGKKISCGTPNLLYCIQVDL